jgi:hypothetical protein
MPFCLAFVSSFKALRPVSRNYSGKTTPRRKNIPCKYIRPLKAVILNPQKQHVANSWGTPRSGFGRLTDEVYSVAPYLVIGQRRESTLKGIDTQPDVAIELLQGHSGSVTIDDK